MRVRRFVVGLFVSILCWNGSTAAQEDEHAGLLLLTPKLLRRLQRDRERQTVRWVNFERRVQNVPDSPERGFELALYYAVTHDKSRGQEAVRWALEKTWSRQTALILNWVGDLVSPEQERRLKDLPRVSTATGPRPAPGLALRDRLFEAVANGTGIGAQFESQDKLLLTDLKKPGSIDFDGLYAAIEYLMTMRSFAHNDLRQSDPQFFNRLPKEVLLSLKPEKVEHPDWMAHIAALALVTLDPNLENSQFLQGWAMEDRQTLREGPGVAYELLWADPYLPGIAYQNMDPWIYDPAGMLFARVDWDPNACWVHVAGRRQDSENCGNSMLAQPVQFGSLMLIPLTSACATIAPRKTRDTTMLWKLKPSAALAFDNGQLRTHQQADAGGMWPVPNDTTGKVCLEGQSKR